MRQYIAKSSMAVILTLAMMFPLYACGNPAKTSGTIPSTTATTVATASQSTASQTVMATNTIAQNFGLGDVPVISNRRPLMVQLELSGSDLLKAGIEKFAQKTGITVGTELMPMQMASIPGAGSGFDIIALQTETLSVQGANLYSLNEMAARYEPSGAAVFKAEFQAMHPLIGRTCSDAGGAVKGMPYYTTTMGMFIRQDLCDDPMEKEAFRKRYGYELEVPATTAHLTNFGQFFTRKKGDLLKGEPLKNDMYGLAMMAGRFKINDEYECRIYGNGGHWATPVRDAAGKVTEHIITKKDKQVILEQIRLYREQLGYASPSCINGSWDSVMPQFESGMCACVPTMYMGFDQWAYNVEDKVPGARLGMYPVSGYNGHTGAWILAITPLCKNPEAAYWLLRYLGSLENQQTMAETGWAITRMDVYDDAKYQTPEWFRRVGYRANVLRDIWDHQLKDCDQLLELSGIYPGLIYEQQVATLNDAATGQISAEDALRELVDETIKVLGKYGSVPIREET
jgi:multiple sugar transport system substrate-binding protein